MRDLLALFVIGACSALVPVVNIEAYLAVRASVAAMDDVWLMALVAALGQMLGKVVWYYLGASSLRWPWARRKLAKPKNAARLETWRARAHHRPFLTGFLLFVSAVTGLPPFAIISVVAGQLRMSLTLFLTVGLLGRWVRFLLVLGGADQIAQLF